MESLALNKMNITPNSPKKLASVSNKTAPKTSEKQTGFCGTSDRFKPQTEPAPANVIPDPMKNGGFCGTMNRPKPKPAVCPFPKVQTEPTPQTEPALFNGGFCGTMNRHEPGSHTSVSSPPLSPPATFEPWLMGEPTDLPILDPEFAAKATDAFGDSALTSIKDERISNIDGYFYQGWETVSPPQSFVDGRVLGHLGEGWKSTDEHGTYRIDSDGVSQELSFDWANNQTTTLKTSYEVKGPEDSNWVEILTINGQGEMKRQYPPRGI